MDCWPEGMTFSKDTNPELAKTFPSMSAILEEMQTIRRPMSCLVAPGHP